MTVSLTHFVFCLVSIRFVVQKLSQQPRKKMYDAYFVDTLTEYGACFWCILAGYSVLKVVYGQSCISVVEKNCLNSRALRWFFLLLRKQHDNKTVCKSYEEHKLLTHESSVLLSCPSKKMSRSKYTVYP